MNYSFRRILKYKITATSYAMCIQYMHVIKHCRSLWLDYTRQLLSFLLCKPANRGSVCLLVYNVSCCAIPPMIVTQEWSLVRYSYRDLEATTRPPLCVWSKLINNTECVFLSKIAESFVCGVGFMGSKFPHKHKDSNTSGGGNELHLLTLL